MLILLSPSKTLDETPVAETGRATIPVFLDEAKILVEKLQKYKEKDLETLMGISKKLAVLNVQRYQSFVTPFTKNNSKQAIRMFKGDVYDGLNAADFNAEDYAFAQKHLRILSGLYGLIRPLDRIRPYRLEMGTRLKNAKGCNLYAFWSESLAKEINGVEQNTVINLASQEYFKAIKPKILKSMLITVHFKEKKHGKYQVIGLFAKRARGMMARYIIKNRLKNAEAIKDFAEDGYTYSPDLSEKSEWVFVRG